jgi:fructose-1,6-bisphosphatase/inositol monophosphatase family enzyme
MSSQMPWPELGTKLAGMVQTMIAEIRPRLLQGALSGEHAESENLRHSDNFLSGHDLWMHERYRELLSEHIPSYVYASEEADPQVIGDDPDPDLCVLVDPLDTSELAVRALHGYTHVMAYSRALRRPVVSVVGDIFHHVQLYLGTLDRDGRDRAFAITADGNRHRLRPRGPVHLAEALITNYSMKPAERFIPLAEQRSLLTALSHRAPDGRNRGRIGVDFGSVSLCHVAAGFTDATFEFAKGFAIWDLAPGHHILHSAGGTTLDLNGRPLNLDHGFDSLSDITQAMSRRQRFVAASSHALAKEITDIFDGGHAHP